MIPGVEPGGDEHEVGGERGDGGDDDLVERVEVAAVTRPGRQRDVDGAAGAGALAPLVEGARARREHRCPGGWRSSARRALVVEHRLRPVAVVHVPVDDGDALYGGVARAWAAAMARLPR